MFPIYRLVIALAFLLVPACQRAPVEYQFSGETMGTSYNITVVDVPTGVEREQLALIIEATLKDVNAHYSNWDPESEISRFNKSESIDEIEISSGLALMLKHADEIYEATDGKFDLTLKPVIDLWGFGPSGRIVERPSDDDIALAQQLTGQNRVLKLSADGTRATKMDPGVSVDLAAIAKGYGIDALASALEAEGIERYMVEIGGDLFVKGETSREASWRIGIERPIAGQRILESVVEIRDVGMATSGDYRNYFEENGVRYSHIIDAATGQPITHHTASVTVIADSAMLADAWATALLAVGETRGLQIADEAGIAALFIVRDRSTDELSFSGKANALFDSYLTMPGD